MDTQLGTEILAAEKDGVEDVVLANEGADATRVLPIHDNGDHRGVAGWGRGESRNTPELPPAHAAPRGPDMYHHCSASVRGQPRGRPFQAPQLKLWKLNPSFQHVPRLIQTESQVEAGNDNDVPDPHANGCPSAARQPSFTR